MKLVVVCAYILSLFLSLGVYKAQSAHALSDTVMIAQVQTGGAGSGTASEEYVLLINSSAEDANVTNWCIEYSSASGNTGSKFCIEPPNELTEIWLESGGLASFATSSFISANPGFAPDITISGGFAATGGHIRLLNSEDTELDKIGWGTAVSPEGDAAGSHASGEVLSRDFSAQIVDSDDNLSDFSSTAILETIVSGLFEEEIIIDLCKNIDDIQAVYPDGYLANEDGDCYEDFCPNIDELQVVAPEGYEKIATSDECTLIPLEDAVIFITEILPNAPSVDTGQEFIELYNPNSNSVDLSGYKLQVGPGFTKEYEFEQNAIEPGQYVTFLDTVTGLTLPNSNGVALRLLAAAGNTVSETAVYSNADDDVSWAFVEDQWIFTNQISPGAANLPYLEDPVDEALGVTSVLGPCPAGKFRNPETNRCKSITTATSQLKPCEDDEFRNPETNRCKKIASSSTSLSPCPEGQERNPETNRCRKVTVLSATDDNIPTVTDVAVESTEGQINWLMILLAIGGTVGYMAYEWRGELQQQYVRIRQS